MTIARSRSSSPQPSIFDLAVAQFDDNSDYEEAVEHSDPNHDPRPRQVAIDFGGLLPAPGLLLKEDATEGCGGRVWPVGMLLGRHLLRYHRNDLGDARILELGAGGGIVGLAVAKACALQHPVMMTDMAFMLPLMDHNIAINGVQDKAKTAVLNWGEPIPEGVKAMKPSVILAADVVYLEKAFPLLLRTFTDLLELNPDAVIYFGGKRRRRADLKFIKQAKRMFTATEPDDDDRVVFERQRMFLFEFRQRRGGQVSKTQSHATIGVTTVAKDL